MTRSAVEALGSCLDHGTAVEAPRMGQRPRSVTSRHAWGSQLPDVVGSLGSFVGVDASCAGGSQDQGDRSNTGYESRSRWDERGVNDGVWRSETRRLRLRRRGRFDEGGCAWPSQQRWDATTAREIARAAGAAARAAATTATAATQRRGAATERPSAPASRCCLRVWRW